MREYVPLHLHTEYSLLDGETRIKDLLNHAKENNMPACAITDHGVMYGAIEFYRTAKERGIKPIIGVEMYVCEKEITLKDTTNNSNYHLILLAKNKEGYKNLVKLVSIAHVEGFYYKPRINHEILKEHHEGLICLSACIGGEIPQHILRGNIEKAKEITKFYQDLFKDDFYLELQDHGMQEQKRVNPELIKIAKEYGIKTVITNDSHYTKREDAKTHDILLCMQTGKTINDPSRMKFPNDEFFIKNADELRTSFDWLEEEEFNKALDNTLEIAEKCNLIIEMGKSILPSYPVPANHTAESYLSKLVREGLVWRYGEITPELEKRCSYELEIIEKMGFAAYFLIVWDFMSYSRKNDIPVGPGRGSAAGSLIAYALGITDLDPIEHNLLFERFLNPERISMPDVDIDFCIEKRAKAIEYVGQTYGEDRVCQIITFGTLAARASMKGVARVLDIPYSDSDKWAKMIPQIPGVKISDALENGMELKAAYDNNPQVKELVDIAKSVEGIKFNIGTHAAGVIISRDPLSDVVPVQRSKEGTIITTYPMSDVEKLGLLKMDFLGLRNLTIIDQTVKMIKKRHGVDLDMNKIPLNDEPTYEMLSRGETDGVFQLESSGMKALVKELKPSVFEDLGALVALYRPGPLNSGMVKVFVDRKHGREKITYDHPSLEPILKDTYGTIVYQEQIMQISQSLAGYTLGQADILRRAMGKKKAEEMDKQRSGFMEGARKNEVDENIAKNLFDTMTEFAAYCFNRSHSAAYAFLAYQTAYLKTHYPVEYMSALLSSVKDNQDKTQLYIAECQRMGMEVLPPDVNMSFADFTPDGENVRFGLASIKNVGLGVVEEIVKTREESPFVSLYDFLTNVDIKVFNKRTLESLIKAGAFSEIEKSRRQLMNNLDSTISEATRKADEKEKGQINMFDMLAAQAGEAPNKFQLMGSDEEFSDSEIQGFEKELLGFYVTSHPLSNIKDQIPFLTTHRIADLGSLKENAYVTVCGLASNIKQITTKNNKLLKVGTIEDLTGGVDFIAFSTALEKYNSLLQPESKLILAGKIRHKGDGEETQTSLSVETVRAVCNCNLVNIHMNTGKSFEQIMALKDLLIKFKGGDPVIFNFMKDEKPVKILTNSNFWIDTTNEAINSIKNSFPDIEVDVKSLDAN